VGEGFHGVIHAQVTPAETVEKLAQFGGIHEEREAMIPPLTPFRGLH
jgi:hypothetical protein